LCKMLPKCFAMAALAVAAMAATPPPPAPPPVYALMQGEAGFLTMFNGHPSEDYGPSTSPGCTTPKVAPSDDTTAAEDCREWCLATAATPLDCQFMWVYNANDTSVPGRCCPKVAFNVSSKADHLVGRGTFYQILGINDKVRPSLELATNGPSCVMLGASAKLCGTGNGDVAIIQPDGTSAAGKVDVGALLGELRALTSTVSSLQSQIDVMKEGAQVAEGWGPNVIKNGDFSSNSSWVTYDITSPSTAKLTANGVTGNAYEVTATDTRGVEQQDISVVPGATYKLSVSFSLVSITGEKTGAARSAGKHPAYVRIFQWSSRKYMGEIGVGDSHKGKGWTRGEYTFTIPSDTAAIGIGLYSRGSGLGKDHCNGTDGKCTIKILWDEVSLVQQTNSTRTCSGATCLANAA